MQCRHFRSRGRSWKTRHFSYSLREEREGAKRALWGGCSEQWGESVEAMRSRACRKDSHSCLRAFSLGMAMRPEVYRSSAPSIPLGQEPPASRILALRPFLPRAPGPAKPELTSKVGTRGLWGIKPNKSFNYLCAHGRSRHLCLIKALVTFESGVLQPCGLLWLCSVSLGELNSYPLNGFQSPSVPSRGRLIYKASLVKSCGSLFEVGSQEA